MWGFSYMKRGAPADGPARRQPLVSSVNKEIEYGNF
jgi:hypothetical protein